MGDTMFGFGKKQKMPMVSIERKQKLDPWAPDQITKIDPNELASLESELKNNLHTNLFGPDLESMMYEEQREISALEEVEKEIVAEIERLQKELENTRLVLIARQAKWEILSTRIPLENVEGYSMEKLREMYFSGQTLPGGMSVEETARAIISADELDSALAADLVGEADLEGLDKPDDFEQEKHSFYADDLNKLQASAPSLEDGKR